MSECTHLITTVKSKPHAVVPLEGGTLHHQKEHETGLWEPAGPERPMGASGFGSVSARHALSKGIFSLKPRRHDSEADRLPNGVFHQFQATPSLASLGPPSWPPPPHPPTPFQSLQGNFPVALIWLLFLKASSRCLFFPRVASLILTARRSLLSLLFLQLLLLPLCLFTSSSSSSSSRKPSVTTEEWREDIPESPVTVQHNLSLSAGLHMSGPEQAGSVSCPHTPPTKRLPFWN